MFDKVNLPDEASGIRIPNERSYFHNSFSVVRYQVISQPVLANISVINTCENFPKEYFAIRTRSGKLDDCINSIWQATYNLPLAGQ